MNHRNGDTYLAVANAAGQAASSLSSFSAWFQSRLVQLWPITIFSNIAAADRFLAPVSRDPWPPKGIETIVEVVVFVEFECEHSV